MTAPADVARLHATFRGRVQGVGFRWTVRENAEHLGLSGWVRNRRDGTVELEVQGPRPAIEALLAALARAFGTGIEERRDAWTGPIAGDAAFEVRPTA